MLKVMINWQHASRLNKVIGALFLTLLLVGLGTLVYLAGGTKYVYVQTMYLPILLAAILFKTRGGFWAAVAAGLVVGPLMPIQVATGEMQLTFNWLFRLGVFVFVGTTSGYVLGVLQQAYFNLQVEIEDRKKAEAKANLLADMALAISNASNFNAAMIATIKNICLEIGWPYGESWVFNPAKDSLVFSTAWHREGQNLERFVEKSKALTFTNGSGLPGLAWQHGQPYWFKDITSEPFFIRRKPALEIGLKTAVGIPVLAREEVIAVIIFFMFDSREEDEHFIKICSSLTSQLGDLFKRRQIEDALLQQECIVRSQRDELAVLYKFSASMRSAKSLNELLPITIQETCRLLEADDGLIALLSPDSRSFTINCGKGYFAGLISKSFSLEEGLSGEVLRIEKPVVSSAYHAEPYALKFDNMDKIGPSVMVPLRSEESLIGVLGITRHLATNNRSFNDSEIKTLAAIGEMSGNAIRRQQLFENARRRLEQVKTLRRIDMAITGSLDLRVTLNTILVEVTKQLQTNAAAILLLETHTGHMLYNAWLGFNTEKHKQLIMRPGEGYAGCTAMQRNLLSIPDLKADTSDHQQKSLLIEEGFTAYHAVPLMAKGHIQGVLEILHRDPLAVNQEWFDFLEVLAGQTAIAIDSAKLFDGLERSNVNLIQAYNATIEGWANALDLKDEETKDHSRRVTEMTVAIARQMNIKDEELAHVRRGALLHDIGKMGIPDSILLKPGPLTEDEWVIMRKHPVYAFEMLAPIDYLRPALDIPYCHHEKWDGSGYPRGLKGKTIPPAARIFAVIDVYDALTSDRPYRKAWSKEDALALIKKDSGSHFDPNVVKVFLEAIEDKLSGWQ